MFVKTLPSPLNVRIQVCRWCRTAPDRTALRSHRPSRPRRSSGRPGRHRVDQVVGLGHVRDDRAPWSERGVERAADVVASEREVPAVVGRARSDDRLVGLNRDVPDVIVARREVGQGLAVAAERRVEGPGLSERRWRRSEADQTHRREPHDHRPALRSASHGQPVLPLTAGRLTCDQTNPPPGCMDTQPASLYHRDPIPATGPRFRLPLAGIDAVRT